MRWLLQAGAGRVADALRTACGPLLAVEKSLHLRHSGDRSTVCAVRVIECAELLAADLFRNADQSRRRISFGDVERYLAQLASHPPTARCGLAPRVTA